MTQRTSYLLAGALLVALAATGCARSHGARPLQAWPLSTDPVVFTDEFNGAVEFQAFGNSKLDALSTDNTNQYLGASCIRVDVPNAGGYAGGAFVASQSRDLSGYTALTFYAKASRNITVDVLGLGNDNTGTSRLEARRNAVSVTTAWTKFTVPIPSPRKLTSERGMFFFAAAPNLGTGYVLWFDEIRFERAVVSNPRPAITAQTLTAFVGGSTAVAGQRDTFLVDGVNHVLVSHMPGWFTYASSNPDVATVSDDGTVRVLTEGTAVITARLDTTLAAGAVTVNAEPFAPGMAPTPTVPAGDVISIFSDAYANRPVDKWSADWDRADLTELAIDGNHLKMYSNLVYAGIEFTTRTIDAAAMNAIHLDVWIPSGTTFKVKLVDFGANGVYEQGGDNSECELTFDAATTPAISTGSWLGLDIPLASFTTLTARAHPAQLILSSSDVRTVYVDNIYFHR
jgi:hypothetical protein